MKILVISRSPWRRDNSFGNTYSSIFSKNEDFQIAHISLADGTPEYEANVRDYFIVPESEVKRSLFKKQKPIGYHLSQKDIVSRSAKTDSSNISTGLPRVPIVYMIRDLVWKMGNINYDALIDFAKRFNPDIMFVPLYYAQYVTKIALRIHKELQVPIVLEASIDVYSLKQLSFDPFFWINRFAIRKCIRKIVKEASMLYVISEKMQSDYGNFFKLPIKILYKIPDATRHKTEYCCFKTNQKYKFIYTGNLGDGRWKSLALLVKALSKSHSGYLEIYSGTNISKEMKTALEVKDVSTIKGKVCSAEIVDIQSKADILVHAEPFDLKSKLWIRYSISTKIMDYLCSGRTILAIGPSNIASIEFLRNHNLALCVTDIKELNKAINQITPSLLVDYSKRGTTYITEKYCEDELRAGFANDLKTLVKYAHPSD